LNEKYEKAYNRAICKAKELKFSGVSWQPIQLLEVGALLPKCFQVQTFMFYDSILGNDGGCILSKSLPMCHTLQQLHMWRSCVGDRFVIALSQVLPDCRNLRHLGLQSNEIADLGVEALANSLLRTRLTVLRIDKNQVSNYGAQRLMAVISETEELECLVICNNNVDDTRKQALTNTWEAAGKTLCSLPKPWQELHHSEQLHFCSSELEKSGGLIV
jgi:hypothetical protein